MFIHSSEFLFFFLLFIQRMKKIEQKAEKKL